MYPITKQCMAAAIVAAAMSAGCSRTVNTVRMDDAGENEWIRTDSGLTKIANVQRISKTHVNGHLRVSVEILNLKDKQRAIQYRFVWLDENNMTLPTPMTTWKREILEGKQTSVLTAIAPDARATDVRLEMIRAE